MRRALFQFLATICVFAYIAQAQVNRGTIFGTVSDATGASVPGASVTVTNTGTGLAFQTQSNEVGFYTAPDVAVGGYEVSAEKAGFKKVVRSGITLVVNQRAQVDLTLEVGDVTESVEVVAAAPLVDTGSATTGKVIEERRIQDLPVNGRNAMSLVVLTPSVKSNAGTTNAGFADRGPRLSALSINGGVNGQNGIILDGGNNINMYQGEVAVNIAVESVQEFKVQTGTMSAEFGFTSGGVINFVTKSGTNDIHGSLYEYLRNDKLDARNAFAARKGPLRFNQYGGSVGGPAIRERTFFFGHFEGFRYILTGQGVGSYPTRAMQGGDFSNLRGATGALIPVYNPWTTRANPSGAGFIRDQFPGNVIPPELLDPVALKFTQTFIPAPNRTPSNPFTTANNFGRLGATTRDMYQYTGRVDHKISDRNTIFGRYSVFQWKTNLGSGGVWPDPVMNQVSIWTVTNRSFVLSDTHVFSPTLINELRVGVTRGTFPFRVSSAGGGWPQKLGLPASYPSDSMPRFNAGLPFYFTGTDGSRPYLGWVFANNVTKIKGSHTLKFGVDHRLNRGGQLLKLNPSGDWSFPAGLTGNPQAQAGTGDAYATFLTGAVASGSVSTHIGEMEHGFTTAAFVQDDWKATRRLTLNLGLRYDYQQKHRERWNGLTNFDPNTKDPVSGLLGRTIYANVDGQPRSFRDPDFTDFAPRFGFAYDMFGRGKTVIRGGYAIYYPSIWYKEMYGSTNGFANTFTFYNPPGGNTNFPAFQLKNGLPFPPIQPLGAALGPNPFLGSQVILEETDGQTPYSQQWTFSLQQQLPGNWVADVSYSANKGTHFSSGDEVGGGYDFNQLDPQYLALGQDLFTQVPNPYAGRVPGGLGAATIAKRQALRPYPYYSGIIVRTPHSTGYTAHYMLFSLEKRMAKGLALLFSYTAGKLISENLSSPINFDAIEQADVVGYQNGKFNRRAERSVDPADISQRAVLSAVYDLPFGRGKRWSSGSGAVNQIIGGWQFNVISVMQNGYPVIVRGANNFLADRPNSTGASPKVDDRTIRRWFDPTVFVNPPNFTYGNLGRVLPDVRQPGTHTWDVSVIKDTKITERVSLQFRFESFNLLNNVNYGGASGGFSPGPDGRNISGGFGVITGSRDARNNQVALKLIF
ncbi:MAG: TonB-dependent receptor [Acidobacteria bacterium]|nr:TonB-dependent receptor [Acidobacteriota bacterium]